MQPLGLTQGALTGAMGVQRKHVNELCNGRRNVTAATALILARVFGNSPDFWSERAAAHRSVGGDAQRPRPQADRASPSVGRRSMMPGVRTPGGPEPVERSPSAASLASSAGSPSPTARGRMKIARWVPGLATLKSYKASFLPHDLAAGLTLGAVMVPVGLAYGELAGLPLAGLYGSMLPLIAYALFGSSRLLIVGPDTAMAAIVAVAVAPLALGDAGAAGAARGGARRHDRRALPAGRPAAAGLRRQLPQQAGHRGLHARARRGGGGRAIAQGAGHQGRRRDHARAACRRPAALGDTNLVTLAIGGATFAVILLCRRFAAARAGRGRGAGRARAWPWCCSTSSARASP